MQKAENNLNDKRPKNRLLMVFYDSLIFLIVWIAVWGLSGNLNKLTLIYMCVGYLIFTSVRLGFRVYKTVLRYGSTGAFGRLICADVIAAAALFLINILAMFFHAPSRVSFLLLGASLASIVLVSLVSRIFYCYLFRYATKHTRSARTVRYLLERIALVDFDSNISGGTLHYVLESDQSNIFINEMQRVANKFAIRGEIKSIKAINKGYINRTYQIETLSDTGNTHKYILQRINTNVFKDVEVLMGNYKLVTETLYGTLIISDDQSHAAVQSLRPTKDGRSFWQDDSGSWRMLTFFDDVYSLDIPDDPNTFEYAGYAFGNFIKAMSHVDINLIKDVIPNFHNTSSRYRDLEHAIELDAAGRVKDVAKEIAFIRARAEKFGYISDALEKGEIPWRICHNDCNLNNILFDVKTHKPVAIIDLDTVMASSPLYDFGDSMRIGTNTAKDDEKDLSKVRCDLNMYEHYARGYLSACGDMLTKRELELLPYAALIITSEDGIRFLMDHIDGDTYYNISYPGQNLDRSRTQLKLLEDMERKLPKIKEILQNIYDDLGLGVKLDINERN